MPPPTPKLPPSPGGTSTGNAADSVEGTADLKPKIDFVDATIYCGIALTCDLLGWIPGVAYATSPASMGGFKLFFWLKGVNPPGGNATLFGGMTAEMVPIVSEILPGCFGYVLLTCAGEMFKDKIAKAAGAVAGAPLAPPQAKLAAGTAAGISQGQDPRAAAYQQGAAMAGRGQTDTSGKSGGVTAGSAGAAAAGPGQGSNAQNAQDAQEDGGESEASTSATFSASSGGDFSGQVDFSSFGQAVGTREEGRTPSGLPQAGPAGAGGPGIPGIAADDGTGGRFAGGSPTSPGGAPTDPQAMARAKSMRAKMRGIKGGGARRIKPTRIYSMEDARRAKEQRDEKERLAREKMAA